MRMVMLAATCAMLGACGSNEAANAGGDAASAGAEGNQAVVQGGGGQQQLLSRDGSAVGTASVSQGQDGVAVRVAVQGLPQGVHGAHLHTVGQCEGPGFESAGPHWNPTGKQHGPENPAGAHLGDLPNLTVSGDGRGSLDFTIPRAQLSGGEAALFDADGAALVIHAQADDYRTDPSGNSGDRIACAVLRQAG